ncbi:MAG: peptidylprolyl isomerase [Spirochaetia bacterium]
MYSRLFRLAALALVLALAVAVSVSAGGGQEEEQESATETEQAAEDSTQSDDAQQQSDGGDGPVAIVNGVEVSNTRFEDAIERNEMQMRQQAQGQEIPEQQLNEMKSQVLEGMINEELLYQVAQENDVGASEEAVEEQIDQYKGQYGDDGFASALQNAGMDEDQLRDEIQRSLTIQNLIEQEVGSEMEVTEEEQREFYDENTEMFEQDERITASHILISTEEAETDEADQEARERAEELRSELEDGADFGELAEEHSEGPSASREGSLGEVSRGQMVPAFEEAAFALEPGEISDVVETQFGYHIIKVDDKSEGGTTPYEEAQGQIGQYLQQQKQQEAIQGYLDELKEDAEIQRLVDFN